MPTKLRSRQTMLYVAEHRGKVLRYRTIRGLAKKITNRMLYFNRPKIRAENNLDIYSDSYEINYDKFNSQFARYYPVIFKIINEKLKACR